MPKTLIFHNGSVFFRSQLSPLTREARSAAQPYIENFGQYRNGCEQARSILASHHIDLATTFWFILPNDAARQFAPTDAACLING